MNIYIYFRSAREDRALLLENLQVMMNSLRRHPGVQCELMLRAEPEKPFLTWMEVYSDVSKDEVGSLLDQLSDWFKRHDLFRLVQGERHVELFERPMESGAPASCADHQEPASARARLR